MKEKLISWASLKLLLCERQYQENEKIRHKLGGNIYESPMIIVLIQNIQRTLKTQQEESKQPNLKKGPKALTNLTKEDIHMASKYVKSWSISYSSRRCKLKYQ